MGIPKNFTTFQKMAAKMADRNFRFLFSAAILAAILKKYATVVIGFYILVLYDLYFIWIDTVLVFVSERKA